MFPGIVLIGIIFALGINIITAGEFANIAALKGANQTKYFWFCFLLGPVGWIMVAALPDRGNPHI